MFPFSLLANVWISCVCMCGCGGCGCGCVGGWVQNNLQVIADHTFDELTQQLLRLVWHESLESIHDAVLGVTR